METISKSYQKHAENEAKNASLGFFLNSDTVNGWRHIRMIETISPFFMNNLGDSFLTIGDGKGYDAYLLKTHNLNVIASSITDSGLKLAQQNGFIDKYQVINAEDIPYGNDSFDFVVCKECYHHFPRPAVAFYEMLRVAKKAVILIEPTDDQSCLLDFIKKPLKKLFRKVDYTEYETWGNFIYRVNSKEIKKMLMALDMPLLGTKYFNDFSNTKIAGSQPNIYSLGYIITKTAIFVQDILCYIRLLRFGKVTLIAFKSDMSQKIKTDLKKTGFRLKVLPRNPYLHS